MCSIWEELTFKLYRVKGLYKPLRMNVSGMLRSSMVSDDALILI